VTVPTADSSSRLDPPRPNPCSGVLTIDYTVGANHRAAAIAVYDVAGRLVRTLRSGPAWPGDDTVIWDGTNSAGDGVAAGVYFIRAEMGAVRLVRKVVMLR
jgi:flagellar hook assembly protein FlgD